MAESKRITDLTVATPALADRLPYADVDDPTDHPDGTTKGITFGGIVALVPPLDPAGLPSVSPATGDILPIADVSNANALSSATVGQILDITHSPKLSQLSTVTVDETADKVAILDVSDTTENAAGTSKLVTIASVLLIALNAATAAINSAIAALTLTMNAADAALQSAIDAVSASLTTLSGTVTSLTTTLTNALPWLFTPSYLTQADWYIDAVNGNDANNGATSGTALATAAELYRRLGPAARIRPAVNGAAFARLWKLHILSDLPVTDPLNIDLAPTQDVSVVILGGVKTQDYSGSITAFTAKATSGGSMARNLLTSSGLAAANTWTSFLAKRIRITQAGAHSDAIAWVDKDLGSKQAATSDFAFIQARRMTADDFLSLTLTQVTPSVNDTFVVETLYTITLGKFQIKSEGTSDFSQFYNPYCIIGELAINIRGEFVPTTIPATQGEVEIHTYSCRFGNVYTTAEFYYSLNDCVSEGSTSSQGGKLLVFKGLTYKWSGLVSAGAQASCVARVYPAGSLYLGYDSQISKGQIQVAGQARINSASIWDTPSTTGTPGGHALALGQLLDNSNDPTCPGAGAVFGNFGAGTVRLWGDGAAGRGVSIGGGCTMQCASGNVPTLTGTHGGTNDFMVAGATTAAAWDQTANSNAGAYTALRNCTWTLFNTAVSSSGFGNNAHNVNKRASIVTV